MDGSTVINPPIPYSAEIPGGLYPGRIIYFNGFVPSSAYRFVINLKAGYPNQPNENLALHISVRFDEKCVCRNSSVNGNWQNEEKFPNTFPLQNNSSFEIILLTEEQHFKIAINGRHFAEFQHRLPVNTIKSIEITGEVKMHQIVYHSNFVMQTPATPWPPGSTYVHPNPSSFAICPPGPPKYKMQPIYNPKMPFNYNFSNGLEPETIICISGRPTPSAQRFRIDFTCGNGPQADIALHINPRFDQRKVVKNSNINKIWGNEEQSPMVFSPGVNFDLVVAIQPQAFQLSLNGQFFGQFQHRVLPVKRVTNLSIEGDIVLTSARFF